MIVGLFVTVIISNTSINLGSDVISSVTEEYVSDTHIYLPKFINDIIKHKIKSTTKEMNESQLILDNKTADHGIVQENKTNVIEYVPTFINETIKDEVKVNIIKIDMNDTKLIKYKENKTNVADYLRNLHLRQEMGCSGNESFWCVQNPPGGTPMKHGSVKHHVFTFKKTKYALKAFCGGSIISETKILTAASCFLTNQKRMKVSLGEVYLAAGVLGTTYDNNFKTSEPAQWRNISQIHSQKFFRHPAFGLAVLVIEVPWSFDEYVGTVSLASLNLNFDGVCSVLVVKGTASWKSYNSLFMVDVKIVDEEECDEVVLKNMHQYYCSEFKDVPSLYTMGIRGSGLLCHRTGDPNEEIGVQGLLVGVTTLLSLNMPCLHNRIALFKKWIDDGGTRTLPSSVLICLMLLSFVFLRCQCIYF